MNPNPDLYVLNARGDPVHEADLDKWFAWRRCFANRQVASRRVGDARVSTVFIGIDSNYSGKGGPQLWETMIFGGPLDHEQWRCSGSREQALAQHHKVLKLARAAKRERV